MMITYPIKSFNLSETIAIGVVQRVVWVLEKAIARARARVQHELGLMSVETRERAAISERRLRVAQRCEPSVL